MRKHILTIYGAVLTVGILYAVWLAVTGIGIPCLFHVLTGLDCPGCGMTRMCLCLLQGDIGGAFRQHPVALITLAVWNIIAVLCFTEKIALVRHPRFLYTMLGISVAVFTVWGVIRNIL